MSGGIAWVGAPEVASDDPIAGYEQLAAVGKRKRGWLVRRALVVADVVGLTVAFTAAEILFTREIGGRISPAEVILFALSLPGWVVIARLYGLYSRDEQRTNHVTTDEAAHAFHMITVCTWIFFAFAYLTRVANPAIGKLLFFWTFATFAVPIARVGARAWARTKPAYLQNTIIIGAGGVGQAVAEKLLRHPEYGVNLLGFVDADAAELQRSSVNGLPVLGPPEALSSIIGLLGIERVIIASPRDSHHEVLGLIRSLKDAFLLVDIVPGYFELIGASTSVSSIEGVPVLCLPPRALGASAQLLKRFMDVVVSAAALLVLLPLFLVLAVVISVDSAGPVFFRQRRIGAHDRSFQIFKFRTMVVDAEERKEVIAHMNKHRDGDDRMFKIPDDPRMTRVGHMLRRFSLDELPQLINVLKGDMSLVGPRPLIPAEDEHVADWGRTRLDLRPGMTGLWQVLGRSEIPFDEMVRLDYVYVTNWSLWEDLRLMCGTIPALVKGGRGAY